MSPAKAAELVDFCRSQLADGPVPSKEFYAALARARICSKSSFDRKHKRALGIKSEKTGFAGEWVTRFELPSDEAERQLQAYLDVEGAKQKSLRSKATPKPPELPMATEAAIARARARDGFAWTSRRGELWCRCEHPNGRKRPDWSFDLDGDPTCWKCGYGPHADYRRKLREWGAKWATRLPSDEFYRPLRLKQAGWYGRGAVRTEGAS